MHTELSSVSLLMAIELPQTVSFNPREILSNRFVRVTTIPKLVDQPRPRPAWWEWHTSPTSRANRVRFRIMLVGFGEARSQYVQAPDRLANPRVIVRTRFRPTLGNRRVDSIDTPRYIRKGTVHRAECG